VVLFGVETASRHWHQAVLRLIPIAAFMLGVVATETLARPRVPAATFAGLCGWRSERK